jgi:hypothetical protein
MEIPLAAASEPASVPAPVKAESITEAERVPAEETAAVSQSVGVVETTETAETAEIPAPLAEPPAEETPAPASIAAPLIPPTPSAQPLPPSAGGNPIDIGRALEISGLVMVETSGEKAKAWQPETKEEPEPRPRRRRPAPAAVSEEPLVMVETRQP